MVNVEPRLGFGYIYVLSNSSYKTNLYKIGLTTSTLKQRINELSSVTPVPTKFNLEKLYEIPIQSLRVVEQQTHKKLKNLGFHAGKEFFECTVEMCCQTIEDVIFETLGETLPDLVYEAKKRAEDEIRQRSEARKIFEIQQAKKKKFDEEVAELNRQIDVQRDRYVSELKKPQKASFTDEFFVTPLMYLGAILLFIFVAYEHFFVAILISLFVFLLIKMENEKENEGYRQKSIDKYPYVTSLYEDSVESKQIIEHKDASSNFSLEMNISEKIIHNDRDGLNIISWDEWFYDEVNKLIFNERTGEVLDEKHVRGYKEIDEFYVLNNQSNIRYLSKSEARKSEFLG